MPAVLVHVYNLNPAVVKIDVFTGLAQCGGLYEKCPT